MALNLYSGNQLEHLAEIFCEKIYRKPCGNIFEPEQVVVLTGGMELFLRKYLAKHSEISANLETPFLNRFVTNIMRALLTPEEYKAYRFSAEQYSPDVLKWRIFDELQNNPDKYPEAEKYSADSTYRYQLSALLADTFDRYIWYHPEMLIAWQKTPCRKEHWEKTLYLALIEKSGPSPESFLSKCFDGNPAEHQAKLARRYSLFGIGSMPPLLLEFCKELGKYTDIHLFYLNPCEEYWGNMLSRREARKAGLSETDDNPIFANLGTWGREFFENTIELLTGNDQENQFTPPAKPDKLLLHRLQHDIYSNTISDSTDIFSQDRSISIHNCHSKRREVEILHDQLLLAIKELNVRPDDIIVMAPDINSYAPFIDAVFSGGKLSNCYNISDRSLVTVSPAAETLVRIIELHSSRCTAEEIVTIIDSPPVRENFELDEEDMKNIKEFITQAHICWGENADTRQEVSQTAFDEFSWQEGLDRLLLGYASVCDSDTLPATPWTPAANIYGDKAELLGKLILIVKNIFKWRRFCKEEHSVADWSALLEEITGVMYDRAYTCKKESDFLKRCISEWHKKAEAADFSSLISVKVLLEEMSSFIGNISDGHGYLSSGITFCSLVPMRSIPAKVIAVLGLKSQDFPRKDPHNGLNISAARKKGERSRLLEDRYLFLETLLAARERLLLFYPGQGANDKSSSYPSAPLTDLLTYLETHFAFKETKHFRHAHNAKYFSSSDPNLYSFSNHCCEIARNIQNPPEAADRSRKICDKGEEKENTDSTLIEYSISDLAYNLSNPLASYLKYSAGIRHLKPQSAFSAAEEPIDLDMPQDILTDIFKSEFNEEDKNRFREQLFFRRELPPGEYGSIFFEQQFNALKSIPGSENLSSLIRQADRGLIDITIGGKFRITGLIDQVPATLNTVQIFKYAGARSKLEFYILNLCNS